MERRQIEGVSGALLDRCPDTPVYTADREILASLTGYELTRGILCALRRPQLPRPEDVLQNARRVAVLCGIVDSTNVGAIFRSTAALGMDAVLLTPASTDPLYRRCIRVSMRKDRTLAANKSALNETVLKFEKDQKYGGYITLNVDPA